MKTRAEAAAFARFLLERADKQTLCEETGISDKGSRRWRHNLGFVEFARLLDFIYEGLPQSEEEKIR